MDFDFDKEVILQNERVLLRPLELTDFDDLLIPAGSDDKLLQFSPKPINTPQLLSAYIEAALAEKLRHERYPFIIYDKQASAYAGSTSFLNIASYHSRLEIGATWLGIDFQKTGLNRHCKFLLLNYAFGVLDFERVEFKTDERNITSRTAIEKIGGRFEGVLRSHTLMHDGFRRNTWCYSILKSEWQTALENGQWDTQKSL